MSDQLPEVTDHDLAMNAVRNRCSFAMEKLYDRYASDPEALERLLDHLLSSETPVDWNPGDTAEKPIVGKAWRVWWKSPSGFKSKASVRNSMRAHEYSRKTGKSRLVMSTTVQKRSLPS